MRASSQASKAAELNPGDPLSSKVLTLWMLSWCPRAHVARVAGEALEGSGKHLLAYWSGNVSLFNSQNGPAVHSC